MNLLILLCMPTFPLCMCMHTCTNTHANIDTFLHKTERLEREALLLFTLVCRSVNFLVAHTLKCMCGVQVSVW